MTPRLGAPLLPAPVAGWPVIAHQGEEAWPAEEVAAALTRIRAEWLWWPQARANAVEKARLSGADLTDLAGFEPSAIEAIDAAEGHRAHIFALMAGLAPGDASALMAASAWRDPWRGGRLTLAEGVEALSLLAAAAARNLGPLRLIGMSRWKRRCVTPFLIGPDGPPGREGRPVVWGGGAAPEGAIRVEDGFLRSVGLGLRHTPPASLAIDAAPPYFDATARNAFEHAVTRAAFTPALLARAAALRARILRLRLSKYNLAGGASLPAAPPGRQAVLVPGQVESDASIRLGGRDVKTNLGLLEAARRAYPRAFLIYKPHPDVLTGLRSGAVDQAEAIADHVETAASAPDCLDWADRVVTITSLMGFEALLRGKAVTTLGRPFYAGWGLTEDFDPPRRDRRLTLDELTAAALILYPRYVDPVTRLPAPVEVVVERLAAEMAAQDSPAARLRRLWRNGLSWTLNRL